MDQFDELVAQLRAIGQREVPSSSGFTARTMARLAAIRPLGVAGRVAARARFPRLKVSLAAAVILALTAGIAIWKTSTGQPAGKAVTPGAPKIFEPAAKSRCRPRPGKERLPQPPSDQGKSPCGGTPGCSCGAENCFCGAMCEADSVAEPDGSSPEEAAPESDARPGPSCCKPQPQLCEIPLDAAVCADRGVKEEAGDPLA